LPVVVSLWQAREVSALSQPADGSATTREGRVTCTSIVAHKLPGGMAARGMNQEIKSGRELAAPQNESENAIPRCAARDILLFRGDQSRGGRHAPGGSP